MPALFIGHGDPINAIDDNVFSRQWIALGERLCRPRAILCISAHWYRPFSAVTAMDPPRTIHDIGGLPGPLHAFQYPARGDLELAICIRDMLEPIAVDLDYNWGLDHGCWSILARTHPLADVPVLELSIDGRFGPAHHFEMGKMLSALRNDGVMLLGSGNIVHNQYLMTDEIESEPLSWAVEFEAHMAEVVLSRQYEDVLDCWRWPDAELAIPTPEHLLPLFYVLGAARDEDEPCVVVEGISGSSVSMLSFQFG
jgi:4,5-DOPA dioxygenase extradiol